MVENTSSNLGQSSAGVQQALHHHWGLFLFEGIVLVILGMIAIALPALASLAATVFLGWLLVLSGVIGLISTIRARRAPGFAWSFASAILGIAAGTVLFWLPLPGTLSLTAVLIAFLFIEGLVSIFYALEHRKALTGRWAWMLASGAVDLVLAFIIFAGLPGTALWALGLIVGINMLFGGWTLIWMALHARARRADAAAT
jgi:uncharacterized membrane protein HdeD (DUF308 family)